MPGKDFEDVTAEDRELRRAPAKASSHENWRLVEESGSHVCVEEIDEEIAFAREYLAHLNEG
jgi:hypothetical protein